MNGTMNIKIMYLTAVVLFFASAVLSVGVSVWYTNAQVDHECAALNQLTSHPFPSNGHPATQEIHLFYQDLVNWRNSDHC